MGVGLEQQTATALGTVELLLEGAIALWTNHGHGGISRYFFVIRCFGGSAQGIASPYRLPKHRLFLEVKRELVQQNKDSRR